MERNLIDDKIMAGDSLWGNLNKFITARDYVSRFAVELQQQQQQQQKLETCVWRSTCAVELSTPPVIDTLCQKACGLVAEAVLVLRPDL